VTRDDPHLLEASAGEPYDPARRPTARARRHLDQAAAGESLEELDQPRKIAITVRVDHFRESRQRNSLSGRIAKVVDDPAAFLPARSFERCLFGRP
jgi:hypothetical protein